MNVSSGEWCACECGVAMGDGVAGVSCVVVCMCVCRCVCVFELRCVLVAWVGSGSHYSLPAVTNATHTSQSHSQHHATSIVTTEREAPADGAF